MSKLTYLHDNLFDDPPVKNWSFSSLTQFEKCPYSILLQKVEKAPRPNYDEMPDHPLTRGTRIHTEAEHYVLGTGPMTPALAKHFKEPFEELRAQYEEGMVELEGEWGYDEDWGQVGFFDDGVWHRAKLDVFVKHDPTTAELIDYKTGKRYGNEVKHTMQGQCYAIAAFMRFPELEFIRTSFWYLDVGGELKNVYTRAKAMDLLPRIVERANKMTSARHFTPKPNKMNCRYCDFGPVNGTGICPYGIDN